MGKMTRCLEDATIVHLIILLLVVILGRLDLFFLHLLGLLLALAVQLSAAVNLISLGILKLKGLRNKEYCKKSSLYKRLRLQLTLNYQCRWNTSERVLSAKMKIFITSECCENTHQFWQ